VYFGCWGVSAPYWDKLPCLVEVKRPKRRHGTMPWPDVLHWEISRIRLRTEVPIPYIRPMFLGYFWGNISRTYCQNICQNSGKLTFFQWIQVWAGGEAQYRDLQHHPERRLPLFRCRGERRRYRALVSPLWSFREQPETWMGNARGETLEIWVGQNLVPLVNPKIAGKWMFIPLKMYL